MRKNIKTNQSKITTIRLTNQNRLIVENECKKLNISINSLINKLIENSVEFNGFIPAEPEEEMKTKRHWKPIYCKELDIEFASKRHCARFFRMSKQTLDKAIEKGYYYSPKLGKTVTFEYITHY